MIFSTRLLILADVSIATFDEEKKEFVSGLNNLSKRKQTEIYNIIWYVFSHDFCLYFYSFVLFQQAPGQGDCRPEDFEEKSML